MRVVAAMSGGVDSAVAAGRMHDAGHEVVGVHLALSQSAATLRESARGCCTIEDAGVARRVADVLGIPFYVWDLAAEFQASVIDDFVAEYAAGRTPNPCVRCNEKIKFAAVLDRALKLGFDGVVTGHHARLVDGVLSRSVDADQDQSYVLAVLTPAQLASTVLPLGTLTKTEVRAQARSRGLAVADKPDSHDICFIADGDTAGFLRSRLGPQPGPIVEDGVVVGTHDGAYAFTVGQRRGLGLARSTPRYVLSLEPVTRTVTVGPAAALDVSTVATGVPVWSSPRPLPLACSVQLRAHGMVHDCTVTASGDGWSLALTTPARGVAAGQTAVLYDGDTVLGSATITSAA
jgi:tRNA-specific 2-thiouridylase